ncbi:serine protease [Bacterioplanes sanyensis]|uniref:patatin-like phospholipase family protein n=1 Tax=Bacterioplanes sanyensis TaxID=1249553 RepID=UPI001676CE29|nr:patatin-like phospholipase family protein [Bacterioplanes sanyensis]GGY32099.1 serine protease [Bacterioplanes sanyensis]
MAKKTVALALGSGGARGYAHIGLIDELERRGYNIVAVSGSSMGAIVGGFYCAGKLEQLREWVCGLSYLDVLRLVDLSLLSSGAVRGDRVFRQLGEMLEGQQIEDMALPFTAVATDLTRKKEVWFQRGDLNHAIRASAAIPSLIMPVPFDSGNGRPSLLVDGGVLNPLPIIPCVSAHAELIIAVDLNANTPVPPAFQASQQPSAEQKQDWFDSVISKASQWLDSKSSEQANENLSKLEVINQMFEIMQSSLSQFKLAGYPPDLLVSMPAEACEMYEFYRADEMIRLGQLVAADALDALEAGTTSLYGKRPG